MAEPPATMELTLPRSSIAISGRDQDWTERQPEPFTRTMNLVNDMCFGAATSPSPFAR